MERLERAEFILKGRIAVLKDMIRKHGFKHSIQVEIQMLRDDLNAVRQAMRISDSLHMESFEQYEQSMQDYFKN